MNKRVKTFKVIGIGNGPIIEYIPTEGTLRKDLYERYKKVGIILPEYNLFDNGIGLEKCDLIVLNKDFEVMFQYMNDNFHLLIKAGQVFDGASVPDFLEIGRISKISQYSLTAALVHDVLYGLKYLEQKHCDDIFEGFLRYKNMKPFTLSLHMAGVRIGGKFVFNEENERSAWYLGYSMLFRNGSLVENYARIKY